MQDQWTKLKSDLGRLISRRLTTGTLEDAAVSAVKQKITMRACAEILSDNEYERGRMIDHVSQYLPAPVHIPSPEPETWPRVLRSETRPPSPYADYDSQTYYDDVAEALAKAAAE